MNEAHLIPNSFSTYNLSEKEALEGSILTDLQQKCLQNQLAIHAEEKLSLQYDPEKPMTFVQQEAYKKGAIDILRYLIDASDAANVELNNPEEIIL